VIAILNFRSFFNPEIPELLQSKFRNFGNKIIGQLIGLNQWSCNRVCSAHWPSAIRGPKFARHSSKFERINVHNILEIHLSNNDNSSNCSQYMVNLHTLSSIFSDVCMAYTLLLMLPLTVANCERFFSKPRSSTQWGRRSGSGSSLA